MNDLVKGINSLLEHHVIYHSDFQIDNFITRKAGGTQYGQFKQSLRELYKRVRGLKQLYAEREFLKIDIDELKYDLENKKDDNQFENRRNAIKLQQKILSQEDLERNVHHTEREMKRFYAQAKVLKDALGDLSTERVKLLDEEMYVHAALRSAALSYATGRSVDGNTMEMIHSMPPARRLEVTNKLSEPPKLVEWYKSYDEALPKLDENILEMDMAEEKLLELNDGTISIEHNTE